MPNGTSGVAYRKDRLIDAALKLNWKGKNAEEIHSLTKRSIWSEIESIHLSRSLSLSQSRDEKIFLGAVASMRPEKATQTRCTCSKEINRSVLIPTLERLTVLIRKRPTRLTNTGTVFHLTESRRSWPYRCALLCPV